jgi:hypothetical protein
MDNILRHSGVGKSSDRSFQSRYLKKTDEGLSRSADPWVELLGLMQQIGPIAQQLLAAELGCLLLLREAMYQAETAECNCEQHYGCAGVRDWFGKKQNNRSDAAIRKFVARAGLPERERT